MKILLVDDDDLSRQIMAEILRDSTDYEIFECHDANEASEIFLTEPCPIVITDIYMSGHSGLELLRDIKSSPSGRDTDVIVITGIASMDNAIEALREGATDFLRKPIDYSHLLEIIDGIVAKQANNGTAKSYKHSNAKQSRRKELPETAEDFNKINPGSIRLPENSFSLNDLVLEIVSKTLDEFEGNQTKTASFLGLSRGKLRTYIDRLN